MRKHKGNPALVSRLREQLREIFAAKGPGVAKEAFGEDDFLLNMSSRANSGEELTPEQRGKVEAIWKRETGRTPS